MVEDSSAHTGPRPAVLGNRPLWWGITVLAVIVALFAGGTVQHAFDDRNAARDLYRMQLNTTFWRILSEENRQLALAPAQRSAATFGDVADSISSDTGVNGQGTLLVSLGAGSDAPPHQAAFAVTVSSPYGSTTVAIWSILYPGSTKGVCVLTSTLLGSGPATSSLELGNELIEPCSPSLWRGGSITPAGPPNLGLAGIDRSGD